MVDLHQTKQQFVSGFALGGDHFLLSLYMSIVAVFALVVPLVLVGPLGPHLGFDTALSWSLRITAFTSALLTAVHFITSTVASGSEIAGAAYVHRHQSLSLLAATHQVKGVGLASFCSAF